MSANRAVTVLRSPSSEVSEISEFNCIGAPASGARRDLPPSSSGFAHSMQNFALGEFSVLQDVHRRVNGDAHSSQKFRPIGIFSSALEAAHCGSPQMARKTVQTKFV
jgi:hypothetical protein